MRIFSIAALAVLTLGAGFAASVPACAQSDDDEAVIHVSQPKKVFGYQDPVTGEFHALGRNHMPVPDATTTPAFTGTLEVVVKITLKTALPTGGSIGCSTSFVAASFSATAPTGANTYEESASAAATVSGTTATCTLKIPYSWVLAAPSTTVQDSLSGSVTVEMYKSVSSTNPSVILTGLVRSNSQNVVSASKFPANGTTTVYNINATL
jgi:hypothetical protein